MARKREVGTLWIGGALSWMEQLCLKSFVDQGQKITLFAYEDIPNVPEGVLRRDGREILDTEDFIKYERKDSFALFADYFRIHMMHQCPGMIWVDTDVYCHRPMDYDDDYVMGFELPGGKRVNNAVLGLPSDSAVLADMIRFMEDRYAVPPFIRPSLQDEYRAAAKAGNPVHVSQQPWGVWGPLMVTHFVHQHGLLDKVQPLEAFYPIPFPDRLKFLRRTAMVKSLLTPQTTALHLWASNKREIGLRHGGVPPAGSYLADLLQRHGLQAGAAPIKGRGKRQFDAALVADVPLAKVGRFADLAGNAQSLALAAWGKWDCEIDLIDVDHRARWLEKPSDWVAPYRAFLTENGVPADKIRLVSKAADLKPVDLLANLNGFGDVYRVSRLEEVLSLCFGSGTCLLTDVRKGSGGFPYLSKKGTTQPLSRRDDGGIEINRVLVIGHGEAAMGVASPAVPKPAPKPVAAVAPRPEQTDDLRPFGIPVGAAPVAVKPGPVVTEDDWEDDHDMRPFGFPVGAAPVTAKPVAGGAEDDWVDDQDMRPFGFPVGDASVAAKPDPVVTEDDWEDDHDMRPFGFPVGAAPVAAKPVSGVTEADGEDDHDMRPFGFPVETKKKILQPGAAAPVVAKDIRVEAPAPAGAEDSSQEAWASIAARLAGADGFVRESDEHSMLYVPRGDTLVVTFDNLDIAMTKREDRRPWGFSFIEKQGWSMLGVMANGWTWYREQWVWDQFDQLATSGFFSKFKRVVFYGASMGGYAACAFVAACPGADVFAISPQSTLDKTIVPWETRYKTAWGRDFSGKYGDASLVSAAAGRVTLLYDPYEPLDSGHVDRFLGQNVLKLRAPLLGHRLGSSLQQMGILAPITLDALNGTLTELDFYQRLRARREFSRYQKELFKRAVDKGHPDLARRMGRFILTRGNNRFIRKGMAELDGLAG